MVIEINMDFLALHNLQPNEYVYLYAKYHNISIPFKSLKMNIKKLEEDGYIKITGKELVSKNIDVQLSHQKDSLQYMQMLEVWINSRTWEKWEGFDNMEEQDGTRNTKQLD